TQALRRARSPRYQAALLLDAPGPRARLDAGALPCARRLPARARLRSAARLSGLPDAARTAQLSESRAPAAAGALAGMAGRQASPRAVLEDPIAHPCIHRGFTCTARCAFGANGRAAARLRRAARRVSLRRH